MKVFGDAGIFPFKLDRNARTQIWAFVLPLVVALNCFFMRWHLRSVHQCKGQGAFSFDLYGTFGNDSWSDFLIDTDIPCASDDTKLFYIFLGATIYICLGLAVMLPAILYLRQRPVGQTRLFE